MDYHSPIIPNGHFLWREALWLPQMHTYADPSDAQIKNIVDLATKMEPLRIMLGKPLHIVSGIRTREYAELLQRQGYRVAMKDSAHYAEHGAGWDLTCPSMTTYDLWHWFDKHWDGRLENHSATPSWVHADTRNWGKRQRFNP